MSLKLKERAFRRIPKDATLSVSIQQTDGSAYFLNARVDKGTTRKKSWNHSQLKNKTIKYKLSETGAYYLRVTTAFTGTKSTKLKLTAKIMKPTGKQHSSTWTITMSGKKPDVFRAKIIASVK